MAHETLQDRNRQGTVRSILMRRLVWLTADLAESFLVHHAYACVIAAEYPCREIDLLPLYGLHRLTVEWTPACIAVWAELDNVSSAMHAKDGFDFARAFFAYNNIPSSTLVILSARFW